MKKVSVIYQGWGERWQLGTLADNGSELLFEYHPEALAQGLELSPRHLKLRSEAYGGFPSYLGRLPGLIADSLPDGWGMLLMDKQFRRAGREPASVSVLDRLSFIGDRAMGALVFEPMEADNLHPEDVSLLSLANEIKQIISGSESESLTQLALIGGSPHGARPKVLVNYETSAGLINTDPSGPGSPWLVKFPGQNEHKEVCAIETIYASLASKCGIDVPHTKYFELSSSLSAFGISRFDRENKMRVPTQTLAGLLHSDFRLPSVDYTTFLRATRYLTKDEREVQAAYLRCVFNVIMHNRDDHAKNVSYCLTRNRQWRLSPGYDLTFSEGPGGEHQMDICGEGRNPDRTNLMKLASESSVDLSYASKVINDVAKVAETFVLESKRYSVRKSTVAKIDALIRNNLSRM